MSAALQTALDLGFAGISLFAGLVIVRAVDHGVCAFLALREERDQLRARLDHERWVRQQSALRASQEYRPEATA